MDPDEANLEEDFDEGSDDGEPDYDLYMTDTVSQLNSSSEYKCKCSMCNFASPSTNFHIKSLSFAKLLIK